MTPQADGLQAGWTRFTADGIISTGPMALHGVVAKASAANAQVLVYNGTDPNSGSLVITIEGPANQSWPIMFTKPLYLPSGGYVDLGSNAEEVLIIWEPIGPARA